MDSKDPKMSPEKYMEMVRELKKRRDKSQASTIPEPVGKWLESRGIDADTLLRLEPLLRKYEGLTEEEKKRFEELKDFEPNPGEATLNKVGETKTYQIGNEGLPIYQEDLDMLRKSIPVAKKLLEIQKRKERLDDTSLLTGPDTTENIKEVYEIDDKGMRKAEAYTPGKDYICGPRVDNKGLDEVRELESVKNCGDWKQWREEHADVLEPMDSGDAMFGVDLETQGLRGGQELMFRRQENLVDLQHDTRGRQIISNMMYPNKEAVDREIERSNNSVSQAKDEDRKDPGDYYKYSNILKRMDDTHTRKNNDYGDAAYQGYKELGDAYYIVQLHNKLSRLKSLTVNRKTQMVKDESIDDTLLDMANYAIMFLESRHRND